jgi:hypothetical protein
MNLLGIILLVIIAIILFSIYYCTGTQNKYRKKNRVSFILCHTKPTRNTSDNYTPDDNNELEPELKRHFLNVQFHTDYRDTITSFNDLAPSQKELFNHTNLPTVHTVLNPNSSETSVLINTFIKQINKDVKYNVSDYLTSNTGWDEPLAQKKQESGWDKFRKELDLPSSLFSDPAKKSSVKLVKIDHIEKYKTDYETKYECILIIQKTNVEDQMIVKVNFIKNYNSNKNTIVIEAIYIIGFLTNEAEDISTPEADMYNFKGLEMNDIIDNKTIINELNKKYDNLNKANYEFSNSLDKEDKQFQKELPPMSSFDTFQYTRSIYDDLSGKPINYD